MKKLCFMLVLLMLVFLAGCGGETVDPDFRNSNWGMTMDEVKKCESEDLAMEIDRGLLYYTEIAGLEGALLYYFDFDEKLYKAQYLLGGEHTSENSYLSAYESLVSALKEKYGDPTEEKTIWEDDLYKDNPNDWEIAISLGDMRMYTKWDTSTTNIRIEIRGGYDSNISVEVFYDSVSYSPNLESKSSGL